VDADFNVKIGDESVVRVGGTAPGSVGEVLTEVSDSGSGMEAVEAVDVALFICGGVVEDVGDEVLDVGFALEDEGDADDGRADTGGLVSGGKKGVTDGFEGPPVILKNLEVEFFPDAVPSASINQSEKTSPYWKSCVISPFHLYIPPAQGLQRSSSSPPSCCRISWTAVASVLQVIT
jgi:hypothetical protein